MSQCYGVSPSQSEPILIDGKKNGAEKRVYFLVEPDVATST